MEWYLGFLIATNLTFLTFGVAAGTAFCLYGMYKALRND